MCFDFFLPQMVGTLLKKSGYSNHLLYMKSCEPWEKNPRLEDTVDDGSEIRLSQPPGM